MLTFLSIQDVVLIERLDLTFHQGFTALTGETGAGKSILLDSLGLVLGSRANAGFIRASAEEARISAGFELPETHPVFQLFQEYAVSAEPGETVILRRTISRDGRSRAWINDQPASLSLLRQVGGLLVEIQEQHAQTGLIDASTHRDLLDSFGHLTDLRSATGSAFAAWKAAMAALTKAEEDIETLRREEDWLRHAEEELSSLAPQQEEEKFLAAQRHSLQTSEKRGEAIAAALSELTPRDRRQNAPSAALRSASRALHRLAPAPSDSSENVIDPLRQGTEEALTALDNAAAALSEAESLLSRLSLECEADPRLLEQTEERLFALRTIARKYNTTPDDLPELLERIRERLHIIDSGVTHLGVLQSAVTETRADFIRAATTLSDARKRCGKDLERAVGEEFKPLRLERARFFADLQPLPEDAWNASGTDQCTFLLAANPGQPPGPIGRVASGGELSRLMLALRLVLAGGSSIGTLVFDEIDAGVGGATAAAIGERLHRLSRNIQVMAVTHSPQVAASADHHLHLGKRVSGQQTKTTASLLPGDARLEEIARMLAGDTVTEEARAAARRLLKIEA
ncbi:MAG: DNA repair protein RecN [Acetobacter sp.]|jgi:DNA repair protein RecN (Recombination protein N)